MLDIGCQLFDNNKILSITIFKIFDNDNIIDGDCQTSYILKQQWCLSVWAVRIFQSLPVPCGVFWGAGGGQHGRERTGWMHYAPGSH